MTSIKVRSVPWQTYDTAEAAIESAREELEKAQGLIKGLIGLNVVRCLTGESELAVELSNGQCLCISCEASGVKWAVRDSACSAVKEDGLPRHVELSFSPFDPKEDRFVSHWDRRDLLDRMIGQPIKSVQPLSPFLFLLAGSAPMLMFSVLEREDTGGLLLYWDRDE